MGSMRKSPGDRANRDTLVYDDLPICWDGVRRGPDLPENQKWCLRTVAWWNTIRKSAQAMAFHDTDWLHLLDTARLHNELWDYDITKGEATSLAGEIRRRTESYGFTWADRRKYGIHITTPEEAATAAEQVTRQHAKPSAIDYRKKLNGLG